MVLSEGAPEREAAKGGEKLFESADKLARYLHVLLAVEYDIDAIDRIAKSRRLDDFMESVYNALRRKLTLEKRLEDLLKKVASSGEKDAVDRAFHYTKDFNPSDIEILRDHLASREFSIKEVASYIGSKAIASTVLSDILMRLAER